MEALTSYNPATAEVVGEVPVTPASEIPAVVARARAAQPAWEALGLQGRIELLRKTAEIFAERVDAHGELMTKEMGKPLKEGIGEAKSLGYIGHELDEIMAALQPEIVEDKRSRSTVYHDPLGVVGAITPWNFPMSMPAWMILPAAAAGNTVVFKPSEETPLCGQAYADVLNEVLPEDVLIVVHGADDQGKAIVQSDVDMIAFTGSREVGKHIMREASGTLKRVVLELGGKDPMIVLEDARVERAAGGAVFGGLMNTGQFCSGIERVYVVRAVADEFIERVVERVQSLKKGRDYGPFILDRQCDIVEQQVSAAVEAGARVLTGGTREGNCYVPTVLVDVDHSMALMTEETFGPVIPIMVVEDEDEAIKLANDSSFGLSASVWTKSKSRGEAVAGRLQSGSVTINETSMIYGALELPFGGVKSSGFGQVNGLNGLYNYCHRMPILTDRFGAKEEAVWHPYTEDKTSKLKKALSAIWGSPLRHLL
jgi:acyl-CoA reductase-like NAD-dependent aldehyde dehydrogenase